MAEAITERVLQKVVIAGGVAVELRLTHARSFRAAGAAASSNFPDPMLKVRETR